MRNKLLKSKFKIKKSKLKTLIGDRYLIFEF